MRAKERGHADRRAWSDPGIPGRTFSGRPTWGQPRRAARGRARSHEPTWHCHCFLKALKVLANPIIGFEYYVVRLLPHPFFPLAHKLSDEFVRQLPLPISEGGANAAIHNKPYGSCIGIA